jgi:hypothetical protein
MKWDMPNGSMRMILLRRLEGQGLNQMCGRRQILSGKRSVCDLSGKDVIAKKRRIRASVVLATLLLIYGQSHGEHHSGALKMNTRCTEILPHTELTFETGIEGSLRHIRLTFTNRSQVPLWIPQEKEPAYRVDAQTQTVTVSYGYFDEVYGRYRGQYMLPPMRMVQPASEYHWQVSDPVLVARVMTPGVRIRIQMRVALRAFSESRVRGAQDLDGYLNDSCVLQSQEFVAVATRVSEASVLPTAMNLKRG